jgi:hypothetical protein
MTDRKWRIVSGLDKKDFYKNVEKYELLGYVLIPDSFGVAAISGNKYYALMKKEK